MTTNITLNSTAFENSEYDEEKAKLAKQNQFKKFSCQSFQKGPQSNKFEQMGTVDEPYLGNKTDSALLIMAKEKFHTFLLDL